MRSIEPPTYSGTFVGPDQNVRTLLFLYPDGKAIESVSAESIVSHAEVDAENEVDGPQARRWWPFGRRRGRGDDAGGAGRLSQR